MSILHVV